MKEDRAVRIRTFLPASVAFVLVSVFAIADNINLTLVASLFLALPYFGLVYLYYRFVTRILDKLQMKSRLLVFGNIVGEIGRYHASTSVPAVMKHEELEENDVNIAETEAKHLNALLNTKTIMSAVVMAFLMTEIRRAFEYLCCHNGIRVSLYMEEEDESLTRTATSELNSNPNHATVFPRGKGFCGRAWHDRVPVCGTRNPFPLRLKFVDDRFFQGPEARDAARSFICLPVINRTGRTEKTIAVISVDSLRRYDYVLGRRFLDEIDVICDPLKAILLEYLEIVRVLKEQQDRMDEGLRHELA
jgi:hypothetical protein